MRSLTFVEIDIPNCGLTYGNAPCQAAIGVTGNQECFNTRRTCQDIVNYSASSLTLRFAIATADLDPAYGAIPSLTSVRTTPAVIDPGVSIGQRESVTCTFTDHPHSDADVDQYVENRSYDPFLQGTFWGKLKARLTSLKGAPLRVIRGEQGQAISAMSTWHYVVESGSGPRGDSFTVIAKDPIKLIDGDRAQAPAISNGEIAVSIGAGDGSLTLSPSGIGDLEYPASGEANLGGTEIVAFTRAGDVLTLTRAQRNTSPVGHDDGEIVQLVLVYDAQSPADIIYDLLVTYTNFDPLWIPLADWQADVDTWIGRLYSAAIAEPTPVRELVDELIEQVGLVMWWAPMQQLARLTALRPVSSSASIYNLDRIMQGSYSSQDQPKKRVSQCWTYFNLINPLEPLDEGQNYQSAVATIDPNDTEPDFDDQPAIRKIYSRWIDANNRPAASRLNELILARYQEPPRRFAWSVFRSDEAPQLGRGARITHWSIQDETGAAAVAPVQIVSVEATDDRYNVVAEEILFTVDDIGGDQTVVIDQDSFDVNLRDLFDQLYTEPSPYGVITFIIDSGVTVGGTMGGTSYPPGDGAAMTALTVGDWPEQPTLLLQNNGAIRGKGGDGGNGFETGINGGDGGTALLTTVPITIENNGIIAGGGGGGGGAYEGGPEFEGASGGGGAGVVAGPGGFVNVVGGNREGADGSVSTGGAGGDIGGATAGDGGDSGVAGTGGSGGSIANGSGGGAGVAVDGDSLIVFDVEGTIVGSRIN